VELRPALASSTAAASSACSRGTSEPCLRRMKKE
jgi:hypothetical protein